MSLDVQAFEIDEHGRKVYLGESAPAGPERWRADVWSSQAVISIAETVRRPRPSRLILPSLRAGHEIFVEGDELDQLEREVDAVSARATAVIHAIGLRAFQSSNGGPSEAELLDHIQSRLHNIKAAIELARTVRRGGVVIA